MNSTPIAVLGGAFDPITLGHLRIAARVAQEGFRVLFMPCGDTHSFGKKMLPSPERVRMAELAAPGQVTDAEIRANSPYAEDTYKNLTETFGEVFWIIGSDNANTLHKWHNGEQLKKLIKFAVVHRPGHPLTEAGQWCLQAPHRYFKIEDVVEISSTAVRQAVGAGDWEAAARMLPTDVLNTIRQKGWYQPTIKLICSPAPRPQVHSGRQGGNQWWKRDVMHAAGDANRTRCGTNAEGWLNIESQPISVALQAKDLCKRCRAALAHP